MKCPLEEHLEAFIDVLIEYLEGRIDKKNLIQMLRNNKERME